jgi:hypothetical protein
MSTELLPWTSFLKNWNSKDWSDVLIYWLSQKNNY